MSITIHIPKGICESSSKERGHFEDSLNEENCGNVSINLPKHQTAKRNDLSKFEVTAKHISGEDINSNLSLDSLFILRASQINHNDGEKEIEMENQIGNFTTPTKDRNSFFINNFYNNETSNNYSSERVICDELNNASQKIRDNKK